MIPTYLLQATSDSGRDNMNMSKLRTRVALWLHGDLSVGGSRRDGLSKICDSGMIDIHIDELLPSLRGEENEIKISSARSAFEVLVDLLQKDLSRFSPTLTIFLKDSRRLQMTPPNLKAIARNMSVTPPSLYVTARGRLNILRPHEAFITPMGRMSSLLDGGVIYATYRTARIIPVTDWHEFSRYIDLEYYSSTSVSETTRAWISSLSRSTPAQKARMPNGRLSQSANRLSLHP